MEDLFIFRTWFKKKQQTNKNTKKLYEETHTFKTHLWQYAVYESCTVLPKRFIQKVPYKLGIFLFF